jgi:hypothetical protein
MTTPLTATASATRTVAASGQDGVKVFGRDDAAVCVHLSTLSEHQRRSCPASGWD